MKIISLASGSTGNAYCAVSGSDAVLVDCGISDRELRRRLAKAGVAVKSVRAILFTHNHADHIKGVATFHHRSPGVLLLSNMMTAEAISAATGVDEEDFTIFENGQTFEIGPFSITAFSVPHDVPDAVGFTIEAGGFRYFHATDAGTVHTLLKWHLSRADAAVLEFNHDPAMLAGSDRPFPLKQRIAGPSGHLSNDDAAEAVRECASPRLKALALAHLSQECNVPHLAVDAANRALAEAGAEGVDVIALPADEITTVYDGESPQDA